MEAEENLTSHDPFMKIRTRHRAALGPGVLATMAILLCALASSAFALSPLPRSDYTVKAVCPPPRPGHASCLSLRLVPRTAEARAHTHPMGASAPFTHTAAAASEGTYGLTPADLHSAYVLPTKATGEPTIALVDAYNDLTAESDLETYDEELKLPACTAGCFAKVNQRESATPPFPKTQAELESFEAGNSFQREEAREAIGWDGEISLDIETAHAICQNCKILLVEADSSQNSDLEAAERAAEKLGASEISNSWGGPEEGESPSSEASSPFKDPHTVITASSGDDGYLEWFSESPSGQAEFPASSPHVVAVGGTRLNLKSDHTWESESVWNDGGEEFGFKVGSGAGGGGCSEIFEAQPWQSSVSDWSSVGCGDKRAVADVSADADPYTGVAVYDTSPECEQEESPFVHWCQIGGTSLASPIIASIYALAGGAQGVEYPAQTLYKKATEHPAALHDVYSGSNGECLRPFARKTGTSGCTPSEDGKSCSLQAICLAHSGYDGPTGVGTPNGLDAFELSPPAETVGEKAQHKEEVEHQEAAESQEAGEREEVEEREEAERIRQAERERREREEREEITRILEKRKATTAPGPPGLPPVVTPAAPAPAPGPQLSALGLTLKALIALNGNHPRITQLSFAFTLNTPAVVKVTLERHVRVHKHTRWERTRNSLTITAKAGRTSGHFASRARLAAGVYRLTAIPLHGASHSIDFKIG